MDDFFLVTWGSSPCFRRTDVARAGAGVHNERMRVAIVGAGVAGLVNAKVLQSLGVEVVVYEARSDVGGVWSATRGYPGQRIQNDKRSYSLSDFPMPESYPSHPGRAQLQAYFAAYARHNRLEASIRCSTTVTQARFDAHLNRWTITGDGPNGRIEDWADWLIIANGTLSTPNRPDLEGADVFARAGGRIVDASEIGDDADFTGQRVVLLGYGKSATDIAAAIAGQAASVSLVARSVPWKLPERLGPLTFEHLVITRLGEHLLWAPYRSLAGRALRRLDTAVRFAFRAALARRLRRSLDVDPRRLQPSSSIRELSHLVTPRFEEAVRAGRVDLRTGVHIARLESGTDGPAVLLDDGTSVPADVLIAATGYRTDIAFLDDVTRSLLIDATGQMRLRRHTLPVRAPRLLFAGWVGSFRSPIASEIQAIWIAALLHGVLEGRRLPVSSAAAPTGLAIVDQDAWLDDVGLPMPWSVTARELLHPLDPADYRDLNARLVRRVAAKAAEAVHGAESIDAGGPELGDEDSSRSGEAIGTTPASARDH